MFGEGMGKFNLLGFVWVLKLNLSLKPKFAIEVFRDRTLIVLKFLTQINQYLFFYNINSSQNPFSLFDKRIYKKNILN